MSGLIDRPEFAQLRDRGADCYVFEKRVGDMDRDELLAVVGFLDEQFSEHLARRAEKKV